MNSTAEIINLGINCLIEKLGIIDTEKFISTIIREKSDYTKWREKYFENVTSENFQKSAIEYSKKNPLFVKENI